MDLGNCLEFNADPFAFLGAYAGIAGRRHIPNCGRGGGRSHRGGAGRGIRWSISDTCVSADRSGATSDEASGQNPKPPNRKAGHLKGGVSRSADSFSFPFALF
jgi:hypothetical protein